MTVPVQVTFKGMDPSPALEARILKKAGRLERFMGDILRCHVVVEAPHRHHHQGNLYRASIEVSVPRGKVVVAHDGPRDHAHEDPYVAVRDAFDAAIRQLEDHARKLHGRVKHHEPPTHGKVARFIAGADYGFIETSDGQEVYFHRNSVVGDRFDGLRVGDEVRLSIAEGDGEKGSQASTVHQLGKHHPVG